MFKSCQPDGITISQKRFRTSPGPLLSLIDNNADNNGAAGLVSSPRLTQTGPVPGMRAGSCRRRSVSGGVTTLVLDFGHLIVRRPMGRASSWDGGRCWAMES